MRSSSSLSSEFEQICKEIFESLGYAVNTNLRTRSGNVVTEIDMVAERMGDPPLFVEVKWIKEAQISLNKMRNWCGRLSNHAKFVEGRQFVLLVSGFVNVSHITWLEKEFSLKIWDRQLLLLKIGHNEMLAEKLVDFLSAVSNVQMSELVF